MKAIVGGASMSIEDCSPIKNMSLPSTMLSLMMVMLEHRVDGPPGAKVRSMSTSV